MGKGKNKGKKKNNQNEEDDEDKEQLPGSKWGQLLSKQQQSDSQQEQQPNAAALYVNTNQKILSFDFTGQQQMRKKLEKEPVKPQPIKLTPQQQQLLKKRLDAQKIQKEEKNKTKKKKKQERQKQIDQLKQRERLQKLRQDQQQAQIESHLKNNNKASSGKWIPIFLIGFLVCISFLQYQQQLYAKLSSFRQNQEQDLYQVLQSDSSYTEKQLKSRYKKLIMKYHPDKNPDCAHCQQKFDKIMQAWEVLGDPQKRKAYDDNSGFIADIKSQTLTLKPVHYEYIVQKSNKIWVIQAYDSTNEYCHHFGTMWEEVYDKYKDKLRFGRVDVWKQSNMVGYIPYRFQVYPGVYIYHQGSSQICHLNYQNPISSISKCIQQYASGLQVPITTISNINELKDSGVQRAIVLSSQLKIKNHLKIILSEYSQFFTIYYLDQADIKNKGIIYLNQNGNYSIFGQFHFKQQSKVYSQKFENLLRSSIIQEKSICQIHDQCYNQKCIIVLSHLQQGQNKKNTLQKMKQLSSQNKEIKYPIFSISAYSFPLSPYSSDRQLFQIQLQQAKKRADLMENFDIGMYMAGQIDFGNWEDLNLLNPQQGQLIELKCEWKGWVDIFLDTSTKVIQKINSKLFSKSSQQQ